jgi:hypothetical protein
MWKLTDEAIREGVKSTTRYRSKQPTKRGARSHHPLPQRQASGAKGGQAAKRSAKMRRSQRDYAHRSDPYAYRSVPGPSPYNPSNFNPCVDTSISYPLSHFTPSDADFAHQMNYDDLGAPLLGPAGDLRPYSASPLSNDSLCGDAAYVQLPQDPSDALFFGTDDSPSPAGSGPYTPPDAQMDCYVDMATPSEGQFDWSEINSNYREI